MNKKMNRKLIVVCLLVFLLVGTDRSVQASAGIDAENVKPKKMRKHACI